MPTVIAIELIIFLLLFGVPLLIAWIAGLLVTRAHEADLARRFTGLGQVNVHDLKCLLDADPRARDDHTPPATLITAEATLGVDHCRGWFGQLKSLLGGQVASYDRVLDRARREVLMRLRERAVERGYNAIANVRIEFADISGSQAYRRKMAMVSILAAATAYRMR